MWYRVGYPVLLTLVFFAPAGADDRTEEKAKHQGQWSVTSLIRNDEEADAEVMASIVRVVDGNQIVWKRNGKSFAGSQFTLGQSGDTLTIDINADGGPAQGKRVLGIYRFEGDTLTLCVGDPDQPRPTTFDAKPGSHKTLQKFKRTKP